MNKDIEINSLSLHFWGVLSTLGKAFETNTLFWSLQRLYGYYYRIMTSLELPREQRPFLDTDVESFIIRMRIVLNDVAFIIRQLLPEDYRGLKNPKGGVHPYNKEMSINDLFKFIEKNPDDYPELTEVFKNNKNWIFRLREERDNIVHYKSIVTIFETKPLPSFAMLNAGRTEDKIQTDDGGERVVLTDIYEYINSQTLSLHNFLHTDLVDGINKCIENHKLEAKNLRITPLLLCTGIPLFKKINKL